MGALPVTNLYEMGADRPLKQWQVREAARKTLLRNQPATLVLGLLAERANEQGLCFPHRETIARETGVALRTLQNVLRCLREIGLVECRRVNQAERMERGVSHCEEYQLHLHAMGRDVSEQYAAAYDQVQGKATRYRGPAVEAKSVAATHVATTENVVAATEKSVAATHPPDPLYGRTSQEHPRNNRARETEQPEPVMELPVLNDWTRILGVLEKRVNPQSFRTWLKPTRYGGMRGGVLLVRLPSAQYGHIGERYGGEIREAIATLALGVDRVEFAVQEMPQVAVVAEPRAPMVLQPPRSFHLRERRPSWSRHLTAAAG